MWYLDGSLSGPPPTLMYFCDGGRKLADNARSLASSNVISFVGVDIANDFGLGFLRDSINTLIVIHRIWIKIHQILVFTVVNFFSSLQQI